jgi:hypothetical protein
MTTSTSLLPAGPCINAYGYLTFIFFFFFFFFFFLFFFFFFFFFCSKHPWILMDISLGALLLICTKIKGPYMVNKLYFHTITTRQHHLWLLLLLLIYT